MEYTVKKGHRVLDVIGAEKEAYRKLGYEVVKLNEETKTYEVIEAATGGRTYTVAEYEALKGALEEEKKRNKQLELEVEELKKAKPTPTSSTKTKAAANKNQ